MCPEDGATGVIPQQPFGIQTGRPARQYNGSRAYSRILRRLYRAGQTIFIHTLGPDIIADARPYAPGLLRGWELRRCNKLCQRRIQYRRRHSLFLGYCNWVEGQLEREDTERQMGKAQEIVLPGRASVGSRRCLLAPHGARPRPRLPLMESYAPQCRMQLTGSERITQS